MSKYIGAIDQGTTSARFMIFDHAGNVVAVDQKEHQRKHEHTSHAFVGFRPKALDNSPQREQRHHTKNNKPRQGSDIQEFMAF